MAVKGLSAVKQYVILTFLIACLAACGGRGSVNQVKNHYKEITPVEQSKRKFGEKEYTFTVADSSVFKSKAASLVEQGYSLLGVSSWIDDVDGDYLNDAVNARMEFADVVLLTNYFAYEHDEVLDLPLPYCCSQPLKERTGECDCCKKQRHITNRYFRHIVCFFGK